MSGGHVTDRRVRRYENGDNFVEIIPSVKGLATVHDRDVLIFCISHLMAALNNKKSVSQIVRFKAYDMLKATNRMTNGQAYDGLVSALTRLRGTIITTNIITGDQEVTRGFGIIESFEIVRNTRAGRMQEVEIKLSDWVFNAIRHKEVLTLHRDYFRLRKPLERRIYELGRKHCGMKPSWKIGLERLQEKCGSTSTMKEFRRLVQKMALLQSFFLYLKLMVILT
nr:replication initiator protein A [Neokomagataea tanensis]